MAQRQHRFSVDYGEQPRHSSSKNAWSVLVSSVVQSTLRVSIQIVVGRFAGPASLGGLATILSTAQIFALFGPTTMGTAVSRYLPAQSGADRAEVGRETERRLGLWAIRLGLSYGALASFSIYFFSHSTQDAVAALAWTAGLVLYSHSRGAHLGAFRMPRILRLELVLTFVYMPVGLYMIWRGFSGSLLLLPLGIGYMAIFLGSRGRGKRKPIPKSTKRDILLFVIAGTAGTLASAGFMHAALLVTRIVYGLEDAGAYAAALTLVGPLSLMVGVLSSVLLPSLSRLAGARYEKSFVDNVVLSHNVLLICFPPFYLTLSAFGPEIVGIIWGERFALTQAMFPILLVGNLSQALATPGMNSIASRGASGMLRLSGAAFLGALIGVAVWLLGQSSASTPNPKIIAWGVATAAIVTGLVITLLSLRYMGISVRKHLAFSVMALAMLVLCAIVLSSSGLDVVRRLVIIFAVGATWIAVTGWGTGVTRRSGGFRIHLGRA